MRRKWDSKTKARIVLEGLTSDCVSEVCRKHGIRPGQFYKWRGHFLDNSFKVFETEPKPQAESDLAAENERLKRLVGELTLELNGNS